MVLEKHQTRGSFLPPGFSFHCISFVGVEGIGRRLAAISAIHIYSPCCRLHDTVLPGRQLAAGLAEASRISVTCKTRMSGEDGSRVLLYVYDLSGGFAAQISQALIGKQVSW